MSPLTRLQARQAFLSTLSPTDVDGVGRSVPIAQRQTRALFDSGDPLRRRDPSSLTIAQLRPCLTYRDLPSIGSKKRLLHRLLEHIAENAPDYNEWTIPLLKEELRRRGVGFGSSERKEMLIERLDEPWRGDGGDKGEIEIPVDEVVEIIPKRRRMSRSPFVIMHDLAPGRTIDSVNIYGDYSKVVVGGRDHTFNGHYTRSTRKDLNVQEQNDDDDGDDDNEMGKPKLEPKPDSKPTSKPRFQPNEKYENWTVKHTCGCGKHFKTTTEYNRHLKTVCTDELRGPGNGLPNDPWKYRLDRKVLEIHDQLPGADEVMPDQAEKDRRSKLLREKGKWHELGNRRPLIDEDVEADKKKEVNKGKGVIVIPP